MDLLGGFSAGEWSPLNGIYNSEDLVDYDHDHDQFMAAHMDCAVANYNIIMGASSLEALPFTIWPSNDSTIVHDVAGSTYNQDHASKFGSSQIANYQPADTNSVASNVAFWGDRGANLFLINDHQWLNINHQEVSCNGEESGGSQTTAAHVVPQLKWEVSDQMMITVPDQSNMEDGSDLVSGNSKKRSRSSTPDDQDPKKYQRNVVKPRKNKKLGLSDNEEDTSAAGSGEHSDASHEDLGAGMASSPSPSLKEAAAPNRNGKKRATRGSATDPQSIYARKRREKINERLRILQNLVPNGTKVDISTMLEEAVQYVKFLQLQIKLLSSDDLWMYAPLAYNGMDIGLDHLRLTAPRQL